MLGLKLNHVSKRVPWTNADFSSTFLTWEQFHKCSQTVNLIHNLFRDYTFNITNLSGVNQLKKSGMVT